MKKYDCRWVIAQFFIDLCLCSLHIIPPAHLSRSSKSSCSAFFSPDVLKAEYFITWWLYPSSTNLSMHCFLLHCLTKAPQRWLFNYRKKRGRLFNVLIQRCRESDLEKVFLYLYIVFPPFFRLLPTPCLLYMLKVVGGVHCSVQTMGSHSSTALIETKEAAACWCGLI